MRRLALPVLVVLGFGAGCVEGEESGSGAGVAGGIPVVVDEYEFVPETITAPPGEISFVVENTGTLAHDLTIDGAEFTVGAKARRTEAGTVELSPGTYTIYCSVAGHRAAGMEGTLTVR